MHYTVRVLRYNTFGMLLKYFLEETLFEILNDFEMIPISIYSSEQVFLLFLSLKIDTDLDSS